MGTDLTLDQLKGIVPGEGERIAAAAGGDDILGKVNSIITGINAIFENVQRFQGNIKAQSPGGPGADQGKGPPADQGDILKVVDQRLLHLVAQTFANKALNIPIKALISDYGDLTIVEAMEKAAKEGES